MKLFFCILLFILFSCSRSKNKNAVNSKILINNSEKKILENNGFSFNIFSTEINNFTKLTLKIGQKDKFNFFIDNSLNVYFNDVNPEYLIDESRVISSESVYANIYGKQLTRLSVPSHYESKTVKTEFFFPYSRKLSNQSFSVCFRSPLTKYKYLNLVFEYKFGKIYYLYSFELN